MKKGMIVFPLLGTIAVLFATACLGPAPENPSTATTSQITSVQPMQKRQVIEVVSVLDTYRTGQTIEPGGPTIEITLKNVSDEPVVSLNVTLEESGSRHFGFVRNPVKLGHLSGPKWATPEVGWGSGAGPLKV